MTLKSLDEFDKEIAAKRARLEKDHALAHALPTKGKLVTWTGEGGWEADGNTRKPPVERTIDIVPHIIHSPFRGAEHVAYTAPDSMGSDGGEHVSSEYRAAFVRKYFLAVLDAYQPFIVDTVRLNGRYKSFVRSTWDWKSNRDHADAEEGESGQYEVTVSRHTGEYSNTSARLEFYVQLESIGPCKISFELIGTHWSRGFRLADGMEPIPAFSGRAHNAAVERWHVCPAFDVGAVSSLVRAGADRNRHGQSNNRTVEWLFDSREAMLAAIGIET